MGWKETLGTARDVVHATFRRPAVYTSPAGVSTNCWVRLHTDLKLFGDLDREGYARMYEDINQAVFDGAEIVPQKNGVIDFAVDDLHVPVPGVELKFDIVNVIPRNGNRYIRTEVTLK